MRLGMDGIDFQIDVPSDANFRELSMEAVRIATDPRWTDPEQFGNAPGRLREEFSGVGIDITGRSMEALLSSDCGRRMTTIPMGASSQPSDDIPDNPFPIERWVDPRAINPAVGLAAGAVVIMLIAAAAGAYVAANSDDD